MKMTCLYTILPDLTAENRFAGTQPSPPSRLSNDADEPNDSPSAFRGMGFIESYGKLF